MAESTPVSDADLEQTLEITEIYKSVQGESTWAGLPCTFVRLTRCHLRCTWCDTAYAFSGGERVSVLEVLKQCGDLGGELIEITGGEPLLQPECLLLAQALVDRNNTVLIETSGALPIDTLPPEVIRIMDLKCPDSGECEKNHWPNIDSLTTRDEVKFVIASRRDYEWAREKVREFGLEQRCNSVLFSPVFGAIEARDIIAWLLEDDLPVRFQLQQHKFVWPVDAQGV